MSKTALLSGTLLVFMLVALWSPFGRKNQLSPESPKDEAIVENELSYDLSSRSEYDQTPQVWAYDDSSLPIPEPAKVIIPKISLDARLVKQGRTPDRSMAVPEENDLAGWWQFGKLPGETGTSVIAGHYKVSDGSPGVFYHLNELQVGDVIKVEDEAGERLEFEIYSREVYREPEFPLEEVFKSGDEKKLNLITCAGSYLREKDDYSHRLVIYTRLIETT